MKPFKHKPTWAYTPAEVLADALGTKEHLHKGKPIIIPPKPPKRETTGVDFHYRAVYNNDTRDYTAICIENTNLRATHPNMKRAIELAQIEVTDYLRRLH